MEKYTASIRVYIVKVNLKFTIEETTKAQRRIRGIALLFL
jgi:hypothetical protein